MDDLIITIYPHAKLFIGYATTAISHALKILYPLINSLWLQYPTGVSIFLVIFVGWFLFRLVNAITSFIYTVTKNIFMAFFYLGIILTILNYYNKKAAGVVLPDGNVVPGFDWDGVWADARGFWGTIQNIGGVVMDLLESGSHLEENAWNSGHRNAAKGSQHPIWNDPGSKASGKRKGR